MRMKIQDKLKYLEENYLGEWIKTRNIVADEISDRQTTFCVCGRLATGLHESYCQKLKKKITNETVKRLNYLIKK